MIHIRQFKTHILIKFLTIFFTVMLASCMTGEGSPASGQRILKHTFLTMGEASGTQRVLIKPDGVRIIDFEFNDRGRGPKNKTIVKLDENALPVSFSSTGHNYSQGEIKENFLIQDKNVNWSSSVQNGSAKFIKNTFYLAVNETPEYRAILARALLASPNKTLNLLPNGNAKIHKARSLTLSNDIQKITINLYEITGLGLTPVYIWLDKNNELFGYDIGWFAVIKAGWENFLDDIKNVQSSVLEEHSAKQLKNLGHKITDVMLLRGARIFDPQKGEFTPPSDITISDGKILKIEKAYSPDSNHGNKHKLEKGNTFTYNANGKFLMASLWDMHGHMYKGRFLNYISGGVLNVRDMANDPAYLKKIQHQIKTNRLAGPDIYPVGFIDKKGKFAAPTGRLADTLEDALSYVDEYAARGFYGIKLYSSIEPDWIKPIADKSHALGMKVMGHIPSFMSAEEAINAGYDEITHINMVLLQLLGDKSIDTRGPLRFIEPGKRGGAIDLTSSETHNFLDLMKTKNVAHDPTMATFMEIFRNRVGEINTISEIYADRLPPSLKRNEIGKKSYNYGHEEVFAKTANTSLALIKLMFDSGITILPGTDYQLPGFSLISELELYHEAGIPNSDILKIATIHPAKYLNLEYSLGSVEKGKKAHLILLNENPLKDISALRNIALVIKGDTFFYPNEVLKSQGIQPFQETRKP